MQPECPQIIRSKLLQLSEHCSCALRNPWFHILCIIASTLLWVEACVRVLFLFWSLLC